MTPTAGIGSRLASWRPPRGTIGIVALGQAGFALRGDADLVLVDPFLSRRPDRLASSMSSTRRHWTPGGVAFACRHAAVHVWQPTQRRRSAIMAQRVIEISRSLW